MSYVSRPRPDEALQMGVRRRRSTLRGHRPAPDGSSPATQQDVRAHYRPPDDSTSTYLSQVK